MKSRKKWTTSSFFGHFGSGVNYLLLALIAVIMLYPFWYIFMYSLSTYQDVIGTRTFVQSYKNTIFVVVVGTVLSVLVTGLLAYPLSRDLQGKRIFNFLIYFTMLFGGGMIPTYYVVRQTGLLNSLWALIIPALVSPYNMFVMRSFFSGIPVDIIDSARIDGASEFRIFYKIIVPFSKPVMATMTLFYAVTYWVKFMDAVLYIRSPQMRPLQLLLRELLNSTSNDLTSEVVNTIGYAATPMSLKMSTVTLSVIPVMIIYPFLQKYFVKGVMIGSVKE